MPGPRDEVRLALEKLRTELHALQTEFREFKATERTRREEQRHEWSDMMTGARNTTERAIAAALGPVEKQLAKLDAVAGELELAKAERIRRSAIETYTETSEMAALRRADRRSKYLMVVGPFLTGLFAAIIAASASHCR